MVGSGRCFGDTRFQELIALRQPPEGVSRPGASSTAAWAPTATAPDAWCRRARAPSTAEPSGPWPCFAGDRWPAGLGDVAAQLFQHLAAGPKPGKLLARLTPGRIGREARKVVGVLTRLSALIWLCAARELPGSGFSERYSTLACRSWSPCWRSSLGRPGASQDLERAAARDGSRRDGLLHTVVPTPDIWAVGLLLQSTFRVGAFPPLHL